MAVKAYKRQLRVYLKPAKETEIKFPYCFFRPLNLVFVLAKHKLLGIGEYNSPWYKLTFFKDPNNSPYCPPSSLGFDASFSRASNASFLACHFLFSYVFHLYKSKFIIILFILCSTNVINTPYRV